jgi:hypothetical protein
VTLMLMHVENGGLAPTGCTLPTSARQRSTAAIVFSTLSCSEQAGYRGWLKLATTRSVGVKLAQRMLKDCLKAPLRSVFR